MPDTLQGHAALLHCSSKKAADVCNAIASTHSLMMPHPEIYLYTSSQEVTVTQDLCKQHAKHVPAIVWWANNTMANQAPAENFPVTTHDSQIPVQSPSESGAARTPALPHQ
jgi:hypothetical protein